jgi:hypothetical protein
MSTATTALRSFAGAPFDPDTYRSLASLLVSFPLAIGYFAVLTAAVSLTLGLSVTLLGPVALLATLLAGAGLAWADAKLTAGLLGTDIDPSFPDTDEGAVAFCKALALTRAGWAGLVYLGWRVVVGIAGFVAAVTGFSLATSLLVAPAVYDAPGVFYRPAALAPATLPEAALLALAGVVVACATLGVVNLLGRLSMGVANALVGS